MIDKRAIIHPKTKLGKNVKIGPYSIIGPHVEIGDNTKIGPYVIINGRTKIGANNRIWQFASLGEEPQDLKYKGEETILEIGDNNIIREFCTINRGTASGRGKTVVGSKNMLMAYVHIAHDCVLGDNIIFANNGTLAGHVTVDNNAVFGGFAAVAQFCLIGAYSFVAGKTGIAKDVPPYVLVSGSHGSVHAYGLNIIGLRRNSFNEETIKNLRHAYHIIYKENLTIKDVLPKLKDMLSECPEVGLLIDHINNSRRGIVR